MFLPCVLLLSLISVTTALRNTRPRTTTKFTPVPLQLFCNMDEEIQPSGTHPGETTESIIATQLNQLKDVRIKMQGDNQRYVDEHPELRGIIDEFMSAAISSKPADILEFGYQYFAEQRQKLFHKSIYPIVFAGPSGVGKGTIVNLLMTRYPSLFGFSVSHTTRRPREGEVDGVHYHFSEMESMERAVGRGEFLEYAKVHGNLYGTSMEAVEEVQSQGKICILDIDIQGVQQVKSSELQCKYIFISPPSMKLLEERLRNRGTESEDSIITRLGQAQNEMTFGEGEGNFDANIINSDLETAFSEAIYYLQYWYPNFDFGYAEE